MSALAPTDRPRRRPFSGYRTSARILRARGRARRAFELRATGVTYQEIADTLGYRGRQGAHDAIKRVRASLPTGAFDSVRLLQTTLLDKLLTAYFPRACEGDPEACAAALRIMDAQTKINGFARAA